MRADKLNFKRNLLLIIIFLILLSVSLIVALGLGHNLIKKYVESEFYSLKIDVLEETMEPYETFFQQAIPEVSYYQGYLDSLSASNYADSVLEKYPFVDHMIFYDSYISDRGITHGITIRNLGIGIKNIYRFGRNLPPDSTVIYQRKKPGELSLKNSDEFNNIGLKVASFIESADTTKNFSNETIFKVFYNITSNRISYLNVPRREEIALFQDLMNSKTEKAPEYEMDLFSFELNPYKLRIANKHQNIYQKTTIRELSYDPILEHTNILQTSIPLSGAFSDYKLYFSTDKNYLQGEVNRRFLPLAFGVFFIYFIIIFITFLIYRNFSISRKLFKLQYDFVNNLTHEFKTPVSVIKIAGNNIKSAQKLSLEEQRHYGKILDEEADKLNDLMNKLLSFTQIENKTIKVKQEEINPEIFSQNIIDGYQLKYPDYEIELDIKKNVKTFLSDPVLLTSIYQNLIENAYKYSKPGTKYLKITISRNRKNIVFSFKDKGIGISPAEMDNIFKKFYRIESEYNQQGSIGLGLAFCKELINLMKGDITVKSKEKTGSEFKVELPYIKK